MAVGSGWSRLEVRWPGAGPRSPEHPPGQRGCSGMMDNFYVNLGVRVTGKFGVNCAGLYQMDMALNNSRLGAPA